MRSNDNDRRFLRKLEGRAEIAEAAGASQISAGKPGETPLKIWEAQGVQVTKRSDDLQGILRVSVGGHDAFGLRYCVFRGDKDACIKLMELAILALRQEPD